MNTESVFYEESGKLNPTGFVLAIIAGIVLTLILGYVYTLIINFIPFIYVNVLVTVGFGMALGYMVRFLVRLTHNRNFQSRLGLAVLVGLLANYFQWIAYLLYVVNEAQTPSFTMYLSNLTWFLDPGSMFALIGDINQFGMWEIFGLPFNGIQLTLVWLIEFGIILVLPFLSVRNMKIVPYSENRAKWYDRFTLENDFESIASRNSILEKLKTDALATIQGLGNGDAWKHSKVYVYFLENEQRQYLDFERVFMEDQEKQKYNRTLLIDNLKIDTSAARMIMQNFKNQKDRMPLI